MLKELLEKQRYYTDHFFNALDLKNVESLLDCFMHCTGTLFFTGVGKSGFIAKKIAFTMSSTGTRASFLSPIDAVHGDLGIVSSNDVMVIFSKSGESDELLHLVPAIRNKGAIPIAIVCSSQSRLAKACDMTFVLPFQKELCPFDMAPTMSTTSQLLLGDLLTIALMKQKNFSLDEYALNHPSGRIGKRITLKVKDLMLTGDKVPLCGPHDLLGRVLVELTNKRSGCILIADQNMKILGIFTDGDLRRTLQKVGGDVLQARMKEIMTVNPSTISPNELAWEAMKRMEADEKRRFMMLPVVDPNSTILGILHLHDIIQCGIS